MQIIAYVHKNGVRFEFEGIPPLQLQSIWSTLADKINEIGGSLHAMCIDMSAETEKMTKPDHLDIKTWIGREIQGVPIYWP